MNRASLIPGFAHRLAKKALYLAKNVTDDPVRLAGYSDQLLHLKHEIDGKLRRMQAAAGELPRLQTFDGREELRVSILEDTTAWSALDVRTTSPGMTTPEECQYYRYIGRFYSGRGEAIELGPWLGRSTFFIAEGLRANPQFQGRRLWVYDDFVWRASWMNGYVPEAERLVNHSDFRHLFDKYTAAHGALLSVHKRKITPYDGNEYVQQLEWTDGPVELLCVDCGRTYEANDAWYRIFSKAFIPDRTLIVMQDWRLQFEIPVRWYNQTKLFTDSKASQLQLVHELKNGTIATFLYRGE